MQHLSLSLGPKWYFLKVRSLGFRNLPIITKAVDIKKTAEFWIPGTAILAKWMDRYIRNHTLEHVQIKPTVDSFL